MCYNRYKGCFLSFSTAWNIFLCPNVQGNSSLILIIVIRSLSDWPVWGWFNISRGLFYPFTISTSVRSFLFQTLLLFAFQPCFMWQSFDYFSILIHPSYTVAFNTFQRWVSCIINVFREWFLVLQSHMYCIKPCSSRLSLQTKGPFQVGKRTLNSKDKEKQVKD